MKEIECVHCHSVMKPKKKAKGSIVAEIILWILGIVGIWFFFPLILVPIVYSGWRLFSHRFIVCRNCGLKIA